jgi:transposase InsO family protein
MYVPFIPLGHPYTAIFTNIVRLHGLPSSIVSDRDPVFTSMFWQELFSIAGIKLSLSSAFHPQLEAMNKVITMYLRCLTEHRPQQWLQWLLWAEFCYNMFFHSSLRTNQCGVWNRSATTATVQL